MEAAKQKVEAVIGQVTAALQTHSHALGDSLQQGGLVPGPATTDGLVPEGFKPQAQLDITYDGQNVELGNFFRASQCKVSPTVSFQREVRKRRLIYWMSLIYRDTLLIIGSYSPLGH